MALREDNDELPLTYELPGGGKAKQEILLDASQLLVQAYWYGVQLCVIFASDEAKLEREKDPNPIIIPYNEPKAQLRLDLNDPDRVPAGSLPYPLHYKSGSKFQKVLATSTSISNCIRIAVVSMAISVRRLGTRSSTLRDEELGRHQPLTNFASSMYKKCVSSSLPNTAVILRLAMSGAYANFSL